MNRRRRGKINRNHGGRKHASDPFHQSWRELIIDGYNLLHVTRFKPSSQAEGELKRCRNGLLNFLASHLPTADFPRVTVIFDAHDAPGHLAPTMQWQHLDVVFARDDNSADDRILTTVREHAWPASLLVVSSDHRVQLAASRRQAGVIDSDVWFDALIAWSGRASNDSKDVPESPEAAKEEQPPSTQNPFPAGYFDELAEEFPDDL